ncbi:Cell division protein FtsN [Cupriavidus sp. OV038]|jgi:cell division protein FtsN|uniref:SPOR domain-containing protein n=1 Tax=unclassified Cupriavidus TaxID=2640874 RepID=UPI0008EF7A91|nr:MULTISPECIES: SPOR domain-containing protein [unclassified Cupriavidus]SFC72056.1 Cell division protein FtsN [Cupriavidus sp. OV038]SFO74699.1 Cell division protein FtsN [Cupriavidus sp. OV096]
MQQQRKRAARPTRTHVRMQRGGTFLGLVLGLIVGLAIAVVVALYITKSPAPFQQKGANGNAQQRPSEPGNVATPLPAPTQPQQQAEGPSDPNRPLWSKTPAKPVGQPDGQPATPAQPPVATTRPADQPANGAASAAKPADASRPAEKPATRPAEKPVADPIAEIAQADANKVGYLLQVGAFRSQDDADRQKANLAMQGFEAKVTERDVNGVKMYRVRLGPFNRIEDMNRARDRLQSNGFEASVIRFTKQ